MKIIVSYCRVSTTKQSKDGIGLDIQKMSNDKSITRILSNDKSLTRIDDIHESISAKDGANLSTLMAIATNRKYSKGSIIVIYDQTRFSRTLPLVAITAMSELLKLGFNIHLSAEDKTITSLDTLDELIVPLVNAASARKESIDRSNRTSGSYQTRLTSGLQNYGGHTPNWIKRVYDDKGKPCDYELIPERQTTINKIYQMYIDGAGANAIVRYLNENINPWSEYDSRRKAPVKNWGESYISKILVNRSVIGERTFNKTNDHELISVTDYYPPAISKELFYQAQAIRKARGRDQVHITKHPTIFYIGITYCGYCRSKMIGQNYTDKKSAIRCVGHSKGESLNCAGGSSPSIFLEQVLIELCKDEVNYNLLFETNKVDLNLMQTKAGELKENIDKNQNTLYKLLKLYLDETLDKDEKVDKESYFKMKGTLQSDTEELKKELTILEHSIEENTHKKTGEDVEFIDLLAQVKLGDIPQSTRLKLKDLLKKFISRIDVYRYGVNWKTEQKWKEFCEFTNHDEDLINFMLEHKNPFEKNRDNLTYNIIFKNGKSRAVWYSYKKKGWTFTATVEGGKTNPD
jgi:DNA invertase Pin-like site-specific DNA recombinase